MNKRSRSSDYYFAQEFKIFTLPLVLGKRDKDYEALPIRAVHADICMANPHK